MKSVRLPRRSLLRGAAGVAVGLPLLECMLPARSAAQDKSTPKRYAILFAGQALGGDEYEKDAQRMNGETLMQAGHHIVPTQEGEGYELTTPLRPMAALREDFSLVSGLRIPYSTTSTEPGAVPPGGAFRDFHGGGASPLLCGVRSTSSNFTAAGISSDQAVAQLHAGQTAVSSLVLRAQPSFYLTGYSFSGRQRISYRGKDDPIEAQDSPRTAFMSLFAGFTPTAGSQQAMLAWNLRARRSVLDLITQKRQRLMALLGAADRARIGRHFDEIRALEQRLSQMPEAAKEVCVPPKEPGADPAVGGDNAGATSGEIATNTGYSGEHERTRFMLDLMHMAFVCDLTRVATLQITAFQSHMNTHAISQHFDSPIALRRPLQADLHEVGHNGDADFRGQLPVSLCLQWHISHYAYLLAKLKATPEGAGNVLDNSAIVFMPEAGHGRHLNTPSDSAPRTHSVEEMILLVAGRAGGLEPGRHIATGGAHPVQCLLGCMQAVGYQQDQLGEVSGALTALRT